MMCIPSNLRPRAEWLAAWEAEAAHRGRERHEATFWRDGGRWIDMERESRRSPAL